MEPVSLFEKTYRELRPRAPMPVIKVQFFAFANINNTIRLRDGVILARLSDLLEGAPESVSHAIAHILLAKLYHKPIDPLHAARYRKHLGSQKISAKALLVRQMRGRKRIGSSQGHAFDLNRIFDELNLKYFHGLLGRPHLTWSSAASRTALGHYDPAHNAIVISRIFDRVEVPPYAVEYIVYHEMLHLKYPVKLRGSRRCVHSAAFQAEERAYPHFEAAQKLLRSL